MEATVMISSTLSSVQRREEFTKHEQNSESFGHLSSDNPQSALHHVEVLAPITLHLPHHDPILPVVPLVLYAALNVIDQDYDTRMPQTYEGSQRLVTRFRDGISRDWVYDILAQNGLGQFRLEDGNVAHDEADISFEQGQAITAGRRFTMATSFVACGVV